MNADAIKEALSIMRGSPLETYVPVADVPFEECHEGGVLCSDPVVSVCMTVYNHQGFLQQAIESIVSQITDFPYELIIGEDCSADDSRRICFEFQKRFPDKIRVLWAERNCNETCGNLLRVLSQCRGEYIAFCEGDDYWIDPHKLQKQVDVMRAHPTVGMFVAKNRVYFNEHGRFVDYESGVEREGVYSGAEIFDAMALKTQMPGVRFGMGFNQTASLVVRASALRGTMEDLPDLFKWRLYQSDHTFRLAIALKWDCWLSNDVLTVYRRNAGGVSVRANGRVEIDALVAAIYLLVKCRGWTFEKALSYFRDWIFVYRMSSAQEMDSQNQKKEFELLRGCRRLSSVFGTWRAWLHMTALRFGCYHGILAHYLTSVYARFPGCKL